ncbi:MAG: hypothetical protein ISP24_03925, partial [Rickettsiales bacterium]|nr:hypothetical protein [Rickettsiales bacterium]
STLIEQAKLRTIINEIMEVQRSVKIFKVAYDYLPGDFPDAGKIWGDDCGGDAPAGNGCNGDGDGVVGRYGGDKFQSYSYEASQVEYYRFWQHMQLADVIDGSYTGVHAITSDEPNWNSGDNVYESKAFPGLLFYLDDVRRWTTRQGDQILWIKSNSSYFWWDDPQTSINPVQTYNIDKKIDDGLATSGFMFGSNIYNNRRAISGCLYDGNYSLDPTKKCRSYIYTKNFW